MEVDWGGGLDTQEHQHLESQSKWTFPGDSAANVRQRPVCKNTGVYVAESFTG